MQSAVLDMVTNTKDGSDILKYLEEEGLSGVILNRYGPSGWPEVRVSGNEEKLLPFLNYFFQENFASLDEFQKFLD